MAIDGEACEWFVLRTRSRQENVVEEYLVQKKVAAYLPKVLRARQWKQRRKTIEFPLFPGYVFVRPQPNQFLILDYIPGSCGLLLDRNKPGIVRKGEINAIRILLGANLPLDIHQGLLSGDKVRVMIGPLAGVEGELVRFKNQHRLVINANILGQAVSVEVNAREISRV